jgi:hypothetical protein
MKKYLLIPFLLFAMPQTAIAQSVAMLNQLPQNYMIWRGKVYDLNHLAGKGASPVAQPQTKAMLTDLEQSYITRETRANKQRVEVENGRAQILIERLQNMR